jgi:alginate O-acetyltransferase complex protein AlgI
MVFNTWLYFFFLAIVLALYVNMRRSAQNWMLLCASCFFYGWWDWRFLFLVGFSTVVDYWMALKMEDSTEPGRRKQFLIISIVSNLAILGFFKYFNFFIGSFNSLLTSLGLDAHFWRLDIILPVGISFYTFHALSYTFDVYRGKLRAARSFKDFALFVMFFPQLVAGPIGRASHQLPQYLRERIITLEGVREGLWLIFWGMFKKVCVADNLAHLVDQNFARSSELNAPVAYLTVVAFAFQIYCDFSGYTDIARGSAKLMGFDILHNFRRPYAAVNPQDFWRRWHISLSSWLRDYLYIPLGGSRFGKWFTYRNLLITMVLGGLWHGAAWNFVWWGIYHGLLLIGFHQWSQWSNRWQPPKTLAIVAMFHLTLLGWLLFRCTRRELVDGIWVDQSFQQILEFLAAPARGFSWTGDATDLVSALALFVLPLLAIERLIDPKQEDRGIYHRPTWVVGLVQAVVAFFIVRYGVQNASAFIYFQF